MLGRGFARCRACQRRAHPHVPARRDGHGDGFHEAHRRTDRVNKLRRIFSLPLLVKELTERSARWRTYGTRALFALGLYGFVALLLPGSFWQPNEMVFYGSFSHPGIGHSIFDRFVAVQAVGIALFLPAV